MSNAEQRGTITLKRRATMPPSASGGWAILEKFMRPGGDVDETGYSGSNHEA